MPAILSSHGCPPPCFTLDLLSMETSRCYCWLFPLSLQSCSPGLEYSSSITCHHVTLLPACRLSPRPIWNLIPILPVNQHRCPPSTHTHIHTYTHTLSLTHSRFSSQRLITPPANLSFTMSQQYFHVPYFDLHYFAFATRSLWLHKWLSRVNASYRWTISFLRSFSDSSPWFAPYSKVDGHHGHSI